ncbi:unnamed protein product [Haemonchus placei]|uniref:BPTI/Kunitz inhibitor domain-containing protein n=1 Tax=Haemonchus placei TaxID=6290 RepID=A0A0N4X426_HAEPC|nr:unnamed protein product [Haemonchus placei]
MPMSNVSMQNTTMLDWRQTVDMCWQSENKAKQCLSASMEGMESIRRCNFPVDMGSKTCDQHATIRYHFDAETMTCLPFKYAGCGGNANNFYSKSECTNECLPKKYIANMRPDCGNRKVVMERDGTFDTIMLGKSCDHQFCPLGAECHRGAYFAYCCH